MLLRPCTSILISLALVTLEASAQVRPAAGTTAATPTPKTKPTLADEMNVWLKNVPPAARAASVLWPAWLKASVMPDGPVPMPADFWSGMDGMKAWTDWASANPGLAKALAKARDAMVLGMTYGPAGDPGLSAKGLEASPGSAAGEAAFPYLRAVRGYAAYAIVEMRRLGDAGKFDDAFRVGLDGLRMLRRGAEQRVCLEKVVMLELMMSSLEAHRCFVADHLERIPAETLRRVAVEEYPFLRPGDTAKLRRLELPEGDRAVAESIFSRTFDANGRPVPEAFASIFAALQAENAPLSRFGAAAAWRTIAGLHGSRDASSGKLNAVYDDWWRRWRMPPYDDMQEWATEISRMNQVRYASILLVAGDVEPVFALRLRLIAEIDGTCVAMGIAGFRAANGRQWPKDLSRLFPQFAVRKMNMDPYSRRFGPFEYRNTGDTPQPIDTPWGQVLASGSILWSVGGDHVDGSSETHDPPDGKGDIVLWPPPRQLAQKAGLIGK